MKVLHPQHNQATVLIFPPLGGKGWQPLHGEQLPEGERGVVRSVNDRSVQNIARIAAGTEGTPFEYMETREIMRDIRWLNKRLSDVPDGTEIGLNATARGYNIDIPDDARPDYTDGLAVGSLVAVGPNISPKAMMNAHGIVKSLNGATAIVDFEQSDIDRVNRATGKNYANPGRLPKQTLEVIA